MSFHFKSADDSLQDGLRRIAKSQIKRALEEAAATDDLSEAVHNVRKRCKKLRALVRLVEPGFSGDPEANRRFRDAARMLSATRDASALVEAYDKLAAACPDRLDRAETATVRAHLVTQRREAHADPEAMSEQMAQFRVAMAEALDAVGQWRIKGKDARVLRESIEAGAERAEKALAKARKAPTAERLHELRKRVKDHLYHTALLRELWPGPMRALNAEVSTLSELLGDIHDLDVLREALDQSPLAPSLTESVVALAGERRAALQEEALALAARVYALPPKAMAKRIEALWHAWPHQAPPPEKDEPEAGDMTEPAGQQLEIERKFLVLGDTWRDAVRESKTIRQAYLATSGRNTMRVRIVDGRVATMTVKSAQATLERTEIEFKIPLAEAEALMALAIGATIEKRRHVVPVGAIDVQVDEFRAPNPALVMAEVELPRPDAPLPVATWLGREVTGNPSYYGAAIAGVDTAPNQSPAA